MVQELWNLELKRTRYKYSKFIDKTRMESNLEINYSCNFYLVNMSGKYIGMI
jgi:hypothetical protein